MKSLFLIIILMLSFYLSATSQNFEFTPLHINFIGIEAKGDTVITWGDHGSMLISFDGAKSWNQTSAFVEHLIIKIFWNDDNIIAVNEHGLVSKSTDYGKTWTIEADLEVPILVIDKDSDVYFIRTPDKILSVNSQYNIINESSLMSPPLPDFFRFQYRKSLAYFNEQLIVAIDTCKFIRYNNDLSIIDTISFPELFGTENFSHFEIDIDSDNFFAGIGNSVYKTNDFKSIEKVLSTTLPGFHKNINSKIYYVSFSSVSGSFSLCLRL